MSGNGYDRITERIISLLEQGTVPWKKPWKASTGWPRNYVSKKPYRGINVFLLVSMSYESPFWLTFRQASELGGNVRKGEKSCPVVFWKRFKVHEEESGEEKEVLLLRIYHVFNAAQCEALKDAPTAENVPVSAKPAQVIAGMPNPPAIKHGMTRAFYSPSEDSIGMPMRERFEIEDDYFATLFHEAVHSTGHAKRLNRATLNESAGFGSDPYCKEELIAEMGAAFLCGYAGIGERTISSSAAYISTWLERLKRDKTLLIQAASQAQRAADFILGTKFAESLEAAP